MMNCLTNDFTFTVPLTLKSHQIAQQFHQQHSNWKKAKQVYLNTLAVYAVKFYLECLGIETAWPASDSWNPAMQTLANMADLAIKNLGKLECCPLLSESQVCQVAPEVWSNRIGYVAVELDHSLTQATLVGFVPTANWEELPLSQLKSLEDLLEHLSQLKQTAPTPDSTPHERGNANAPNVATRSQPTNKWIQLSQWLHDIFETGWERVEALFDPPQAELAFRYKSVSQTKTTTTETLASGVKRGKRLSLERVGEEVALCVGLMPTNALEMEISVGVYPTSGQTYLPQDLQLLVLDEKGEAVMQAHANGTKTIQFQFMGELGERFSVQVALGDVSLTETFLV